MEKFNRTSVFFLSLFLMVGVFGLATPASILRAEEGSKLRSNLSSSASAQKPLPSINTGGRRFLNFRFSPAIFSKRAWNWWDWFFFVIFVAASFVFLFCLFLISSDSLWIPENIAFAVAILSGAIAFPWYLSLFAVPPALLNLAFWICLAMIVTTVLYLINQWNKRNQKKKKPDIFLE